MADKTYRFVIRKEPKYTRSFAPAKKKSLGLGSILEIILAMFKTKTAKQDAKSAQTLEKNKPVVRGVMRQVFMIFGIFVVIIALLIGFLLFSLQGSGPGEVQSQAIPEAHITLNVEDYGVANVKEHSVMTPYAIVKVEGAGVKEVRLFIEASEAPLFNEIYILNSRREQATYYDEFKSQLSEEMKEKGIAVNEIYLEELKSLPNGSNPLIIIPTGYIPAELAVTSGEGKSLKELAQKGATILYIGYGFDQGLMDERRGRLFPGVDYSTKQVSTNMGFDIASNAPPLSGLSYLDTARYAVTVGYTGSDTSEKTRVEQIFGGIQAINWGGPGYLIIVPNTLDSGWKNGKDAAKDIATIINSKQWMVAYDTFIGQSEPDYITFEEGSNTIYDTLFTKGKSSSLDSSYARVYAIAYGEDKTKIIDAETRYLKINRAQRGTIASTLYALPEKISGSKLDLEAFFDENPSEFRQPTQVWVRVMNSSNEVASESIFGSQYILPIKYMQKAQFDPKLPPGRYIISLQTPTTPPKNLAKSILVVPKVNVVPVSIDWKKQLFVFSLDVPEIPNSEQYAKNLDKTNVVIDDKLRVPITVGVNANTPVIVFKVDEPLEEGKKHTFRFEAVDGLEYTGVSNIVRMYYEQWWFWAVILGSGGVVGIGIAFRAREKVRYAIDIPDFEIRKKKKIFIKKEMVLDLFNSINKDYGWHYMPLMIKELKSGFRKITYQGRPILIGDYNMQVILDKLKYEGLVKEYIDLWTVTKWEQMSGFDYKYLSVFRRIRDILINNAVPFTHLNERKDCDVYIKSKRENMKVVVGEGGRLVERITNAISGKERVVLVFASEEHKDEFVKSISGYGANGAAIKIALLNDKLILTTLKDFASLIK